MTFVVTFRFRGKTEVQEFRLASSLKLDGKGALILYDKNRGIMENLMLSELSDFSIEASAARQPAALVDGARSTPTASHKKNAATSYRTPPRGILRFQQKTSTLSPVPHPRS